MLFSLNIDHELCFEFGSLLEIYLQLSYHNCYDAFPTEILQKIKALRVKGSDLTDLFEDLVEVLIKGFLSGFNESMIFDGGGFSLLDVVKNLRHFF